MLSLVLCFVDYRKKLEQQELLKWEVFCKSRPSELLTNESRKLMYEAQSLGGKVYLIADGNELQAIREQLRGIRSAPNLSIVQWIGDEALFILENLTGDYDAD